MIITVQDDEKFDTTEDYINDMIRQGYMAEDGTPLKCKCGCTDFEMSDEYRGSYGLEEYSLKCTKCSMTVGHWAYGYWQL